MRFILAIVLFFSLKVSGQVINGSAPYRVRTAAVSIDTTLQRFLDSTGITDATIKSALVVLVRELRDSLIWDSLDVIYPFVGGTATTHKYNLKNPSIYTAQYSGTYTHSSTGIIPTSGSTYINTGYNFRTASKDKNSCHVSFYSRTNLVGATAVMGVYDGTNETSIYPRYTGDVTYAAINSNSAANIKTGTTTSATYYIAYRNISTYDSLLYLGSSYARNINSLNTPNIEMYIFALNYNGLASNYSLHECAFATIGGGLTTRMATALNIIVEKFNDALSRGVQ